jgi:hypothetical protein
VDLAGDDEPAAPGDDLGLDDPEADGELRVVELVTVGREPAGAVRSAA